MEIRSASSGVGSNGSGASTLIAIWTSPTVLGADANFAYDGTTLFLANDIKMNQAATAAAQSVLRQRANTGSVAVWGGPTSSAGYVEVYGNLHATKPQWIEMSGIVKCLNARLGIGADSDVNNIINARSDQNGTSRFTIVNANAGASAASQIKIGSEPGDFNMSASSIANGAGVTLTADAAFTGGLSIAILGSNSLKLRTNSVDGIVVDSNQKITIGTSGNGQFHKVFGRGIQVAYAAAGVTGYFELDHSSNTANSGAALFLSVAGGSGGNPYTAYSVTGATDWVSGINNGSSDAYQICASAAIGSNIFFAISTAGIVTLGTGTTTTHVLNTQLGTAASDVLTMTNGPTGKAGNPAVYIQINVNGTNRQIPAW